MLHSNSSSELLDDAVMQCKLGGESGYYFEEGDGIVGGHVHEDDDGNQDVIISDKTCYSHGGM